MITEQPIVVRGAKEHNLKDVDATFPRHQFIVVTGVSGSGKSSLVIDTLFAEGQRRYVESLSSYARQFLMRMDKPDVDFIEGISPAIAIDQKVTTKNSRSTVGTLTETYDYLRLLYARIGKTYSPISGEIVKKDRVTDVVDFVMHLNAGTKLQVLAPVKLADDRTFAKQIELLLQNGYNRIFSNGQMHRIDDVLADDALIASLEALPFAIVVDRLAVNPEDEDFQGRLADSVQTAFFESHGDCIIDLLEEGQKEFNNRFELDGIVFNEPTPNFFSYNNPYGACKRCEGFGNIIGIDEDLVVPNKNQSIYEGAIACWKGEKMKAWKDRLVETSHEFDFPIHKPYRELTEEQKDLLWEGNRYFRGIDEFFQHLEENSYKIQYRVMLSRYRGRTKCPECKTTRIRKEANYVKIGGKSISQLMLMQVSHLQVFFDELELNEHDATIAKRITQEITNRLQFMMDVGLGYLALNRASNTLSGGETQRIHLTRTLGSNLTDSLYILDEPSVGLHPRDTNRLIKVLKELRDLGNTVVVVEHEEDMIRAADYLIDMGPEAGVFGGEVVYQGNAKGIASVPTLTSKYLSGELEVPVPKIRRTSANFIEIIGASEHNLQNIDVRIPLQSLTAVSGVSGSGKTTLIKRILYPALKRQIENAGDKPGLHQELKGDLSRINAVEMIDQNPLGRSSRSNPVTYIKAYDAIRDLYSKQQISKVRGYKPKHFSFNVEGGRCETCQGEGYQTVEMQFLADVRLICEECNGRRFKEDILEVKYKDHSIHDLLELSVDEALEFFEGHKDIYLKLKPLSDVGLGYVKLGQSSNTLSGGEAQRVKLASYLVKGSSLDPILFIFDEPTTGLHFHDVNKLISAFDALIDNGHSVLVIEHDMDVLKCADWLIDLGPDAGDRGGSLVYQGVPEGILDVADSFTGQFLKEKL
ncbi:MAG: excinuclease ABC subunit UvrA [Saprospiraceae bacterium]|nr:excinuclease ABC subunit UvrA [Saprospiraceae bacterium]